MFSLRLQLSAVLQGNKSSGITQMLLKEEPFSKEEINLISQLFEVKVKNLTEIEAFEKIIRKTESWSGWKLTILFFLLHYKMAIKSCLWISGLPCLQLSIPNKHRKSFTSSSRNYHFYLEKKPLISEKNYLASHKSLGQHKKQYYEKCM